MKHAQIIGQTFVYLMGVLIFIIIIIYGYTKIDDLWKRQQEICIERMGQDMRARVDEVGLSFDVRNHALTSCGEWNTVCFWTNEWNGPGCSNIDWMPVEQTYFSDPTAPKILDSGLKPPLTISRKITSCIDDANMAVYKKGSVDVKFFNIGNIQLGKSIRQHMCDENSADCYGGTPEAYQFNCFYAPTGTVYLRIRGTGSKAIISAEYPGRYANPHAPSP